MTSLGGMLCRFAIFAHQKWQTVHFRNTDHCSVRWVCCWVKSRTLQDMDKMEASCIIYVKIGMFTHHEQSNISGLTVNKTVIVRLTVQQILIVSVSFMYHHSDDLRWPSADVLPLEQCAICRWQSWNFGCRTLQFIPVNKQTTLVWLIAHLGAVGNPCNLQLYAVWFILSISNMLAATYSILTWG